MKFLILIMVIIPVNKSFPQISDCDSIIWTNSAKLTWGDFKKTSDSTNEFTALSMINVGYMLKRFDDTVTLIATCSFKPCLSWSKAKRSLLLLAHEQGHFDIAEYFKRLFIKAIAEKQFSRQNYIDSINAIFVANRYMNDTLDDKYDGETMHGKSKQHQFLATVKNTELLNSLKNYNQIIIHFILNR